MERWKAERKKLWNWNNSKLLLVGGFKYLYFHLYLGKIPILTRIFQLGWFNHQLDYCWWFLRNPAETHQLSVVGSWNTPIFTRFFEKYPRWLALGFLKHQQYHLFIERISGGTKHVKLQLYLYIYRTFTLFSKNLTAFRTQKSWRVEPCFQGFRKKKKTPRNQHRQLGFCSSLCLHPHGYQ